MLGSDASRRLVAVDLGSVPFFLPVGLVALDPAVEVPATFSKGGKRKVVLLILCRFVLEELGAAAGPVVCKRHVVGILHKLVDAQEVDVAVLSVGERYVRSDEGVVHRREPLLAIQDDVFGAIVIAGIPVNWLARERVEVLFLYLSK